MVDEGNPSETPVDPPKKKGFDLSIFHAHIAEADTSIGKVYLYPLRTSDIGKLEKLTTAEPISRFRDFLPCIASLSAITKEDKARAPLTLAEIAILSDSEIEQIAETYALSSVLQQTRLGKDEKEGLPRQAGEVAVAYLDRLLRKYLVEQVASMESLRKQMFGPASSLFDSVRKSSSILSKSLTEYENLSSGSLFPKIDTRVPEYVNHMAEQRARQARDRAEELEIIRLTGKMTAQSATALRDLVDSATVLLARLEARDEKSDRDTRRQLRIAVWSVGISAFLALLALIVSVTSFKQDKFNNESDDKWQAKVLATLQEENGRQKLLESENNKLKARLEKLENTTARASAKKTAQGNVAKTMP